MASYRIGIGSFNLKDGAVGIGTESSGLGNLKVEGTIKTTDLDVTGISTFIRYSGLNADQFNINRDTTFDNKETVTYTVTVAGGIFYIDGVSAPRLELKRGSTYIFDQSEGTNSGHPLRFKDRAGESYYDGVSVDGTPGSSGALTQLKVNVNAPDTLRYYCTVHGNGMGNIISVVDSTFYSLQNIGDVVVGDDNILSVGSGSTSFTGVFDYVCVKHHFSVPTGDTAGRDKSSGYSEGTIRFNRDLDTMEFFNGDEWRQFTYRSGAGRGYIAGGQAPGPAAVNSIDLINISTLGNAVHFGDNSSGSSMRMNVGRASSAIEGFVMSDGSDATILYFTMSTQGNATEFAEQSYTDTAASLASSTRALSASASSSSKAVDYIEMSTKANAIDFGDLTLGRNELGAVSSPTRGIFCGGGAPSGSAPKSRMDFFTIASKGNAITFGELTDTRGQLGGGVSDGVRGVVAGGSAAAAPYGKNTIDYMTIASTGNAIRFGDLMVSAGRGEQAGATCNRVRGIFCGGYVAPAPSKSMEYITIASSGNGQDFGDLTTFAGRIGGGCISDSHGGLGGY